MLYIVVDWQGKTHELMCSRLWQMKKQGPHAMAIAKPGEPVPRLRQSFHMIPAEQ